MKIFDLKVRILILVCSKKIRVLIPACSKKNNMCWDWTDFTTYSGFDKTQVPVGCTSVDISEYRSNIKCLLLS